MSLILDELTDVTNAAQVLFIWNLSAEFEITKELASVNTRHGTTMGECF